MKHAGRWTIVAAAFGLCGAPGVRAEEAPSGAPPAPPAALPLDKAAEQGLVEVKGSRPGGFEEIDLCLTSKSQEPLTLDLAGRHLRPRTGNVQRLGLSHPVTPPTAQRPARRGTVELTLAPGETRSIRMRT